MTATDVINETRAYVIENFLYMRRDPFLADEDLLIRQRVIDSIGVVELVQFIEDRFGVRLENDEITEENIGSLAAIARFVVGKKTVGILDLERERVRLPA